ncbi:hypothetical protein F2Q70_00005133 [Brassica cretica]|uniref:Uncharacterized protein n=1 Tax=Brassica cretica TaxID=69181 RepID=A0A8S9IRY0_BRACR|nr:hypothetical protein F2Q70_00005133 [Brassica cretica]
MFDSLALAFHTKFDSYGREPEIIIATSVNLKIVGTLFLNATSGTHLYFDSETAAGKKVFDTSEDLGAFTSKVVHAQKIEPMTISELNQFIITADSQIIEFLCTAKFTLSSKMTVGVILAAPGVPRNLSERYLPSHVFHVMKLMLLLHSAFDMEMAKLTNIQASEAAQIVGIGVDAQVDTELPRFLADIVGKPYTFQLKLNISISPHQTFTISLIFPERVLVPMPAFVEVANVPADAQAEDVAQGTNANVGITSTGADKPTISDASTGKRPPQAKDQDDVDKTAPKKAHVE